MGNRAGPQVAAALLSGGLWYAAFPPLEWAGTAWIALIPLLWVCLHVTPREGFRLGWATGAIFWWSTIFWLTEVSWTGWFLLALYCATYTGLFGCLAVNLLNPARRSHAGYRLAGLLVLPLAWAGLEFMRSVFLTGFAWNPLGGSQYQQLFLIQISALTGVYGVSALIVLINLAIVLTIERYTNPQTRGPRPWHPEMMVGTLVLALTAGYGLRVMRSGPADTAHSIRLAAIQPNIPQYEKWSPEFVDHIYARLEALTTMAIESGQPDLVIWPETAVPDYVRDSRRSYELVRNVTRRGAPLLVGSMDIEWQDDASPRYYNSSILFDREGRVLEAYDKIHLVMFGEYVPLQRFLPFLRTMTPIEASFDAGREHTIFSVPEKDYPFAALICFEDTVARLARCAVRKGARLLVNQTNVAWFRESPAARQHMTHSVFRAVENRVPVVRAANTGVSGGIDHHGRIHNMIIDTKGKPFVHGFSIIPVQPPPPGDLPTLYTRWGDWFGWTGLMVAALLFTLQWTRGRTGKRAV